MKLLSSLLKRVRGHFLRTRIESIRPDLAGLPLDDLIDRYVEQLIADALEEDPTINETSLPLLAELALTHTATESAGHYRVKALLAEAYYWKEFEDHIKTSQKNIELKADAQEATAIGNMALDAAGELLDHINNQPLPPVHLN